MATMISTEAVIRAPSAPERRAPVPGERAIDHPSGEQRVEHGDHRGPVERAGRDAAQNQAPALPAPAASVKLFSIRAATADNSNLVAARFTEMY